MNTRLTSPISNSMQLRKALDGIRRRRSRPRANRSVFMAEQLETRQCLSAVSFASHDVFNEISEPVATFADLDNDGDMDIVAGSGGFVRSPSGSRISWFENIDGQAGYGSEQIITTNVSRVTSIEVVDIDADGDLDVVSGSQFDGKIALYENIDGMGGFGPQQIIDSGNQTPSSIRFSDIDADGDSDLIASFTTADQTGKYESHERLAWYPNNDGQFGDRQIVADRIIGTSRGLAFEAGDVDGDGDQDLVSVSAAFTSDPAFPDESEIA